MHLRASIVRALYRVMVDLIANFLCSDWLHSIQPHSAVEPKGTRRFNRLQTAEGNARTGLHV